MQAALGHWDEGARLLGAAMAIDPLFAGWHEILGNIRLREGRYAEAEAELRKTLQIGPTYGSGHYYLGQTLLFQGKLEDALTEMQQEAPDSGQDAGLASVYHAMGRKAESDRAYAQKDVEPYWIRGDRLLKILEADPRHQAFLKKMNLP